MTKPEDTADLLDEAIKAMAAKPGMTLDPERIYRRRRIEAAGDGERLRRETELAEEVAAIRADAARLSAPAIDPPKANKRTGRPPTRRQAQVDAVRAIIAAFGEVMGAFPENTLPAPKKDFLAACEKLENAVTGKRLLFRIEKDAITDIVKAAGYRFATGKPAGNGCPYTSRVVQISGIIAPSTFTPG